MKVRNAMTTKVVTINSQATYAEAAKVLFENNIKGAPIIDDTGQLVGLISDKDLFKVLFPFGRSYNVNPEEYLDFEKREEKIDEIRDKPIETIMIKKVLTVDPETPIMKAGGLMLAEGVHRLVVIENNKVIGIISRSDIFGRIIKKHLGINT